MPQVKLFGILHRYAGSPQLELPGTTVRAVLKALCAMNTELCAAIRDENGLRQYVRAMLNGHDVELAQGLEPPLAPNDEIAIFPPIAGG